MNMKRKIRLFSSIVVLVLSGMWLASAGGYGPLIGFVPSGIATLLEIFYIPAHSRERWRPISTIGKKPSEIVRECKGAVELARTSFGKIRRKGM